MQKQKGRLVRVGEWTSYSIPGRPYQPGEMWAKMWRKWVTYTDIKGGVGVFQTQGTSSAKVISGFEWNTLFKYITLIQFYKNYTCEHRKGNTKEKLLATDPLGTWRLILAG